MDEAAVFTQLVNAAMDQWPMVALALVVTLRWLKQGQEQFQAAVGKIDAIHDDLKKNNENASQAQDLLREALEEIRDARERGSRHSGQIRAITAELDTVKVKIDEITRSGATHRRPGPEG